MATKKTGTKKSTSGKNTKAGAKKNATTKKAPAKKPVEKKIDDAKVQEYIKTPEAAKHVIETAMKEGCLLRIRMSAWGNRAVLDKNEVEQLSEKFVRGSKDLVDSDALLNLRSLRYEVMRYIRANCLPWIDDGIYFIPKSKVAETSEYLDDAIKRMNDEVAALCEMYEELKLAMKKEIDDANKRNRTNIKFDESKYPTVATLREKFSISYQFFFVAVPESGGILDSKQIAREREKLNATIKEAAEIGILWVRKKFTEVVANLNEKLSTGGKFKNASVTNLQEFIDEFDKLNVWNDAELKKIVDQCRKSIKGVDPQALRDDEEFAKKIESEMSGVVASIKKLGDGRLKRAVDF